jgi:hypothetical protein
MAVLSSNLQHIIALLEDAKESAADRETRLRYLEGTRIPLLENRTTRVEERQGVMAGLQAAYTTIAAAVVAFLK